MSAMLKYIYNDFKLVFRDSSLRVFWLLPFLILLVINYFVPYLIQEYEVVNDYVIYVLMMAITQTTNMFSFIYSMVFIDEKDTQVAKVYGVLPISHFGFTIMRLSIPYLISVLFSILILATQPFYAFSFLEILLLSMLTGFLAPILAIAVAILSKNKMDGMTWNKFFGLPISLPILAFFVPVSYKYLFSPFPTHWLFQTINNIALNESYWINFTIGFVICIALTVFLAKRFVTTHFT